MRVNIVNKKQIFLHSFLFFNLAFFLIETKVNSSSKSKAQVFLLQAIIFYIYTAVLSYSK